MQSVGTAIALVIVSVGTAGADGKSSREAYDTCLTDGMVKFKDLCEPADQIAEAVVIGCNPQLYSLLTFLEHLKVSDLVKLAAQARHTKADQIMSLLLEYRLQHPCQ
ncbi:MULTISPECIES: hypothetical protein [unclassified Mesorhizobium]|uniref:hypothetical protein n=1 Tax=unclassified Mesorhizobium TaxID=325217 RepID=UPI000FDCA10A|nr:MULTISPECIES: hypothetical protein [unclassified Mesorhizobium]TGQ29825.1 hypothetical protein EN859_032695 [Mesorhizobium sp. M00.F.Ca.ET.216.01.1.1]TIS55755.1 MAG: hypothetical protein E5W91_20320 [Mesorhizobium sp.]TIS89849.1 MAG: hypothetical protein E5W89_15300 [Mesorhizobium sp.]TJW03952.1 MAG: hypothetical protein E5W82_31360 [Mesorhizobium sp.]TJW44269.1 MAG: hypothetical protein E5W83_15035 [Mesorhizobium sp.]